MRCRVATMMGCWLSAIPSTANAQPRCSMYKLPTTKAIAANPTANRANTANSSRTKYVCSRTSTARNIHIHFRLLSLVFILSLFLIAHSVTLWALTYVHTCFDAATCPLGPVDSLYLPHLTPFSL